MLLKLIAFWLSFRPLTLAGTVPHKAELLPSSRVIVESHGSQSRNCWHDGFSIATDLDAKAPPAGKTVIYNLEITNTTLNPDGGGDRPVMLINGTFPGPVLHTSWGDTLVVNVKNLLENNGTGIHWHGVRQLNFCQNDGVPGVTAPGKTRQYVFSCTQFGTTWYHSHWSSQYAEGTLGTLIIDGPATANYNEDLGTLPISDWYYKPGFELSEQAQHSQLGPPLPDNILVNGTHVNAQGGGSYFNIKVKKGRKYRIRLINTSVDSTFSVSMDQHPFTVMTSDFVPIRSFVTDQLTLAIGQRYDVVINANQTIDNYWFRVSIGTDCGNNTMVTMNITLGAILQCEGASGANPNTTGVQMRTTCTDETNLVPFVPNSVPTNIVRQAEMKINHTQDINNSFLFRWTINGTPLVVDWDTPSLETALTPSGTFGPFSNVYEMNNSNWYFWWIQTTDPIIALPHPIHLHGHDFYILGSGGGTWDGTTDGLNFQNPTRRDTATLPAGGYLLIAFPADNPGLWVMHCHIAWHAGQGLSVQFMERRSEIRRSIGSLQEFDKGCDEWDDYWVPGRHLFNQTDSGI